jgi:glycosyltransferase involved in cell wall biosynthesis
MLLAYAGKRRGSRDFVRVVGEVRRVRPHLRALLAADQPGQPALLSGLRDEVDKAGVADCLLLPGLISPATGTLGTSRVLFHPTYEDHAPRIVLEAMASGCAVVAYDVGAIRELVGDAAFVVPAGDLRSASRAIERLLCSEEHRRVVAERARQRVAHLFGARQFAERHLQVYAPSVVSR